jgi:hypothetical protein
VVARCRLARMSSSTLFDRATSAAHHEHATEDRRTRQAGRAAPARKHVAELVEVEVRRSHSARHKTARHGSLEEIARVERSALAHATVNEGDPTRARAVASSWREFRACVVVKIRASHVHLLDIHRERSRSASDGAACEPLSLSGSHAAESTLPSRRCSQSGASGQGEARRGRTSRLRAFEQGEVEASAQPWEQQSCGGAFDSAPRRSDGAPPGPAPHGPWPRAGPGPGTRSHGSPPTTSPPAILATSSSYAAVR